MWDCSPENATVIFTNAGTVQQSLGRPQKLHMNDSKDLPARQAEWCPSSHLNGDSLLNILKAEV